MEKWAYESDGCKVRAHPDGGTEVVFYDGGTIRMDEPVDLVVAWLQAPHEPMN